MTDGVTVPPRARPRAAWYGAPRPELDDEVNDRAVAVPVATLLDRVVRTLGAPGADAVDVVFNRWHEVVGTVLAGQTRPVAIHDGVLTLEADEPVVVSHVRYLESTMVARLAELLGAGRVTGVAVRVTPPQRRRGRPSTRAR